MLARLRAAAVFGIHAVPVSVEVDVSPGLPGMTMVGLPDTTVRESRERVRAAIRNAGFPYPPDRVTVSLAPADVRKIGAAFDLPIALGILSASGVLPHREESRFTIVGGVSLDGAVPPMRGLLPIAAAARETTGALMFPAANTREASIVSSLQLFPVASLMDAVRILVAPSPQPSPPVPGDSVSDSVGAEDLSDVRGQPVGRRAIEIAAAGGHHLLFSGPPGAGKTMLARRLPGILPPLDFDEALTVTTIHSVAGLLPQNGGLVSARPFRSPHHTCSEVALVGGGSMPRPGELSLAHGGVLFLDELPEFSRRVLETLRQPLEHGVIHISRATHSVVFPARVILVGAMNPCPCGYLESGQQLCRCSALSVERYRGRLSGPLRDRFDLCLHLPALAWTELRTSAPSECSADVRARVVAARRKQADRQGTTNAQLDGRQLEATCRVEGAAERLLANAVARFSLSARAVARVLRVARTIADLEPSDDVTRAHVAEALQLRGADRASG